MRLAATGPAMSISILLAAAALQAAPAAAAPAGPIEFRFVGIDLINAAGPWPIQTGDLVRVAE